MSDRVYLGNLKKKEFANGGRLLKGSLCKEDLMRAFDFHGTTSQKNGKTYINIEIKGRKEADQWGNTHYIELDTWKPEQTQGDGNFKPQMNNYENQQPPQNSAGFEDDVPF